MPYVHLRDAYLRPGLTAPFSGVYRVIHREHRADHLVTVLKGDPFPGCRKCKEDVRYELYIDAEYVTHEWDFAGPSMSLLDRRVEIRETEGGKEAPSLRSIRSNAKSGKRRMSGGQDAKNARTAAAGDKA